MMERGRSTQISADKHKYVSPGQPVRGVDQIKCFVTTLHISDEFSDVTRYFSGI